MSLRNVGSSMAVATLAVGFAMAQTRDAGASDPYQTTLAPIGLAVNKAESKLVYSIPVHFQTQTLTAVLDTGSIPLLVLAGRLTSRDGQPTGASSSVTYGDDRIYYYSVEKGPVTVGNDWRGIAFGVVTKAHCTTSDPTCTIHGENEYTALFGGLYPAIVGARNTTSGDTLQIAFGQLGVQRFVISAPRLGEGPGYLALNPNSNTTARFVAIKTATDTDAPSATVRACVRDKTHGQYYCGPVLLDTGTTGVTVTPAAGGAAHPFAKGDLAQIEFTGDDGADLAGVDFTVGADSPTTVTVKAPATSGGVVINVGQVPYIGLDILSDLDDGTYAVSPRPRAKDGVTGHVP